MPAPTVSPINSHYREQLKGVKAALDQVRPGAVDLRAFDSLAQFSDVMAKVIEATVPYALTYQEA